MGRALAIAVVVLSVVSSSEWARAATLTVGPGKMYAAPCAAVAAAADGDTIEIDAAGTYDGDVCAIAKNNLTLRGTGGRPKIDAAGKNHGGKGIWVISGHDTTVENIEFSGATVPDKNGAGIRQEGANLTVRRCYFHDNENGILSGANAASAIVVEYSEFANNGFGDGFSHNMYIGHEGRFTLRYSYSHHAKAGHLVKSRAAENYILYNRLTGEDGTASYELDLPNAGTSYVIGNLVEQSASSQNSTLMTYGVEGTTPENPGHALFVVNNTFVNDRAAGGTFIAVGGAITTPIVVTNNVFAGGGTTATQASAVLTTNFTQGDPLFVGRGAFDYRLLSGSPCVNAGSDPGMGGGFALSPSRQYVHPANAVDRSIVGSIVDIGAYEYGAGESDAGADASTMPDGASGDAARDGTTIPDAPRDATIDVNARDATIDANARDATIDANARDATIDANARDATMDTVLGDANPRDVPAAEGGASDAPGEDGPPTPLPDASSDAPTPPAGPSDGGGCGCRIERSHPTSSAAIAFIACLAAACQRRRRAPPGSRR